MHPPRTQGAISKLETGTDEELPFGEVREYARILKTRIGAVYGPPANHVDSIKNHVFEIRRHLLELARLAHQDTEIENHIQAFYGETLFNILNIIGSCQQQMPHADKMSIRMEIVEPRAASVPPEKPCNPPAALTV